MTDLPAGTILPPCAAHLGAEILELDREAGRVRVAFRGRDEFLNPAGFVQGGFLTAMMDDAMGLCVVTATGGANYMSTISLTTVFLAPARAGRMEAEARVVRLGGTIGFLEASLTAPDGTEVARASAQVRLVKPPVG